MKHARLKETGLKQVNVVLSDFEYDILSMLGGPTSVLKNYIYEHAGDLHKLKIERERCCKIIEKETEKMTSLDVMISKYEELEREEKRMREEIDSLHAKASLIRKKKPNSGKWADKDKINKIKPRLKKLYIEDGALTQDNYNMVMSRMGFKSQQEVDEWLRVD